MRRISWRGLALLLALSSAVSMAISQAPAAQKLAAQGASDQPQVTRADLAAAYLRLEQAYLAKPPQGEAIATINRGFDQATMAFFMGRNAEALRAIDQLSEELVNEQRPAVMKAVLSLKATPEPAVWRLDSDEPRKLRLQSVYDWKSNELGAVNLEARLLAPDGTTLARLPVTVLLGGKSEVDTMVSVPETTRLPAGVCRIGLGLPAQPGHVAGRVNVVRSSLDALREANSGQLAKIDAASPTVEKALASCRARNQLLSDRPSPAQSAQFMADLQALADNVAEEITSLAVGKNPYASRLGDTWRVFLNRKREIPLRVYAPKAAAGQPPLPLLVVLHGMGGDENMFFEAYGAGVVTQLAEEHGFLVASPLTYTFGGDVRTLEALIDDLSADYRIDRDRVYVLGHSMGAGATASLARGHADTIAAACCIAGGSLSATPGTPPVLVVIPELDGVVPPARVRSSANRAVAAGVPVEVREMAGFGHTLAVGVALPDAVEWLLKHKRPASAATD